MKPERLDKVVTLRLSERLYNELVQLARRDRRRLNDYLRLVAEDHVERTRTEVRDDA